MLIDTHCHLNDEKLLPEADRIVSEFSAAGIECAVCVGYDSASSVTAAELAEKYERVYFAAGIHPHDADSANSTAYAEISRLAKNGKCVAIGEIGLDYYYDLSPRDVQKRVLSEQLELAYELDLPVILHVRDAYEDANRILSENKKKLVNGVLLHCYSGSAEMVRDFDKFDAYYAFGGAITFKGAHRNLESLLNVKSDRLLFETDCPYMTPVPFRGRINEPKYINYVAQKAAETLEKDITELERTTTENAKRLFKKLK